jgi:hypothetical protein
MKTYIIIVFLLIFLTGCVSDEMTMAEMQEKAMEEQRIIEEKTKEISPEEQELIEEPLIEQEPEEPVQEGITIEELAKHNSFKDCWVVYEGKVYDITEAGRHPNMPETFWSHCGKTSGFEEGAKVRHGSRSSSSRVENYGVYIGELI